MGRYNCDKAATVDAVKYKGSINNISSTDKFVLIALAKCSNDNTGLCFPSASRLSKMTKFSRPAVSKAIGRLQEYGAISVDDRRDQGLTNNYKILWDNFLTLDQESIVNETSPIPCNPRLQVVSSLITGYENYSFKGCNPSLFGVSSSITWGVIEGYVGCNLGLPLENNLENKVENNINNNINTDLISVDKKHVENVGEVIQDHSVDSDEKVQAEEPKGELVEIIQSKPNKRKFRYTSKQKITASKPVVDESTEAAPEPSPLSTSLAISEVSPNHDHVQGEGFIQGCEYSRSEALSVIEFYNLHSGRKIILTPDREKLIHHALKSGRGYRDIRSAIKGLFHPKSAWWQENGKTGFKYALGNETKKESEQFTNMDNFILLGENRPDDPNLITEDMVQEPEPINKNSIDYMLHDTSWADNLDIEPH